MRNLLWIGDAGVDSGFARATHYTLRGLDYRLEGKFNCSVLGVNYLGDPDVRRKYPYDIYPCWPGKDMLGKGRLEDVLPLVDPHVIVIQNDPWNIPGYMAALEEFSCKVPVIGIMAVDGKNCRGGKVNGKDHIERGLNPLAHVIFWTEFGRNEAVQGGYTGPTSVVPLGVDREIYKPQDRMESRRWLGLPVPKDCFLVGSVGRNQPRKRLDLTMIYFAEWIKKYKRDDAYLFIHCAPTGESAFDLKQLGEYLGLTGRVVISTPDARKGFSEETMARLYAAMNVLVSTSQGEGFWLPGIEAMACDRLVMAPDWSGVGDWAKSGAYLIPCTSLACTFHEINVIGGVPDQQAFIMALDEVYQHPEIVDNIAMQGFNLSQNPRFNWRNIAREVSNVVDSVLAPEEQLELVDAGA